MGRLRNAIAAFRYAWKHGDDKERLRKLQARIKAKEEKQSSALDALSESDKHFAASFIHNLPDKMDREDIKRFVAIVETLPQEAQYWLISKAVDKYPTLVSSRAMFDWCKKNAGWVMNWKKQQNPGA